METEKARKSAINAVCSNPSWVGTSCFDWTFTSFVSLLDTSSIVQIQFLLHYCLNRLLLLSLIVYILLSITGHFCRRRRETILSPETLTPHSINSSPLLIWVCLVWALQLQLCNFLHTPCSKHEFHFKPDTNLLLFQHFCCNLGSFSRSFGTRTIHLKRNDLSFSTSILSLSTTSFHLYDSRRSRCRLIPFICLFLYRNSPSILETSAFSAFFIFSFLPIFSSDLAQPRLSLHRYQQIEMQQTVFLPPTAQRWHLRLERRRRPS